MEAFASDDTPWKTDAGYVYEFRIQKQLEGRSNRLF